MISSVSWMSLLQKLDFVLTGDGAPQSSILPKSHHFRVFCEGFFNISLKIRFIQLYSLFYQSWLDYKVNVSWILCLHDLPSLSLSPTLRFLARSGPPFVIRGIPIQWERSGLKMADLSERNNAVGGEREEIEQPQNRLSCLMWKAWSTIGNHCKRWTRVSCRLPTCYQCESRTGLELIPKSLWLDW